MTRTADGHGIFSGALDRRADLCYADSVKFLEKARRDRMADCIAEGLWRLDLPWQGNPLKNLNS